MSLPARQPAVSERPLEFSDRHESLKILGFWFFLASDLVLFACLFAVYAVYQGRVAGGPTPAQLFRFPPVLVETLLLLTSSFTCGLATYSMRKNHRKGVVVSLLVTVALGVGFVGLEIAEFLSDALRGATWHHSAFLSAFFALVGTHGGHVSFGIIWAVVLVIQVMTRGLTSLTTRRLYTFSLYWHFLDIVWVFIFTSVYLSGTLT